MATAFGPEDNYLGNLVGALNQIDAGVTTLVDGAARLKQVAAVCSGEPELA
jgi:X-X-X-Leu-X-X-Gly heptad repeat protein